MLFDEPTSASIPELVGEVLDVMRELARERHDDDRRHARDGLCTGGRRCVSFMDDGCIVESGDAREDAGDPRHDRTKAFLSKVL